MQKRSFSDEELTAFLDGEEDHAPVADIKSALQSDTALAQRLDALRIDRQIIVAAFTAWSSQARHPYCDRDGESGQTSVAITSPRERRRSS